MKIKTLAKYNKKGPLSGLRQFLSAESPLKMIKNAFYFLLLTLVVTPWPCRKRPRLISKFIASQTGKHNYNTHIAHYLKR